MQPVDLPPLVDRARSGDAAALDALFRHFEPQLVRMVDLRLDASLRRRLDPSDVVQESWVEVVRRFPEWCRQTELPFHVWLRLIAAQSLAQAQRRHLGARMRDAQREIQLHHSRASVTAGNAADAFIASITSPSQAAQREELRAHVLAALEELDEIDREIVALRHFEGLSNEDVAAELSITPDAASKRFLRALLRLRPALEALASVDSGGRA
ncbi:MAG: sigma-70 family RNA polymerase sigma factor [Planctomycetes bacterium]|nr:sigma-70 family RNA polymerase sigma factor [Planctomycetota bacterium]